MAKKRPTLDAFLIPSIDTGAAGAAPAKSRSSARKASPIEKPNKKAAETKKEVPTKSEKHEVVRHMLYLPLPVYEQLEELMFEERRGQAKKRRAQEYLHEAIDLLFKDRGLKSIAELTDKK